MTLSKCSQNWYYLFMKNTIYILASALFIYFFSNLPFLNRDRSTYYPLFNSYYCNSRKGCLHEIGHASDDSLGWISQSRNYELELITYLVVNWKMPLEQRHPMAERAAFSPGYFAPLEKESNPFYWSFWEGGWGGERELYAEMLSWADGLSENIPQSLRTFYNWELIDKEITKIDLYSNE